MFIENLISELYKPSYKSDVLDDIEAKLNYNFKRRDLLKESFYVLLEMVAKNRFIHCNACKQALESAGLRSYELMELFGNFFLKLAITIDLYKKYPTLEAGILTKLRSQIMDNEKLAKVAVNKLYLHNHISCANVPRKKGNSSKYLIQIKTFIDDMTKYKDLNPLEVLFNSVKTIAGAMFLDSTKLTENIGCCLEQVWEKLENLLEPLTTPKTLDEHPVSKLQELCQKLGKRVEYKHHKFKFKVFDEEEITVVEVFINDKKFGMGECIKKEVAKKRAARDGLAQLEQESED
ncbi:endoribonuclease Dicer homolog 1-like [Cryptomeria japonica]|uniref:endoribonuclease Dicer homolog 1-like n=1 Tax=Cryptomeria japonica TaxID=3369 RepID=UPI0027D9E62A|nr:endoribonuclease Dicer homolog 1-like [Cryptomeria japonica]